jgi:hypothetical protein
MARMLQIKRKDWDYTNDIDMAYGFDHHLAV